MFEICGTIMKTISYRNDDWYKILKKLAREHGTVFYLEEALGFKLRREQRIINRDNSEFNKFNVHLDFSNERDYTFFVLKYL